MMEGEPSLNDLLFLLLKITIASQYIATLLTSLHRYHLSLPQFLSFANMSKRCGARESFACRLTICIQSLNHPVNHVLIQFYRTGADYISDHADKTVDVVRGSNIVNVSLGAQRTMTLRLKRDRKPKVATDESAESTASSTAAGAGTPRDVQRIPLPHNSMFVMGSQTNMKWLHGINHDNRPFNTKSAAEQFNQCARISLTFRHIGTFMSKDGTRIWGQGAKGKTKEEAGLISTDQGEVERLIEAFGDENQQSEFDWDARYGTGFDVLHFVTKG